MNITASLPGYMVKYRGMPIETTICQLVSEMMDDYAICVDEWDTYYDFVSLKEPMVNTLRWRIRKEKLLTINDRKVYIQGILHTLTEETSRQLADISLEYAVMYKLKS